MRCLCDIGSDPWEILGTVQKLCLVLAFILALASPYPGLAEEIVAGVSDTPSVSVAQPGSINFDPPSVFIETLPLQIYMTGATKAIFIGGGAVLNEGSGFKVTGHSAPNFLAWNSSARNSDGSVPALPEILAFTTPVSSVSINVGTGWSQGQTAGLIALDGEFNVLGFDTVTISSAMQTLSVTADNISFALIVGPPYLAADDLVFE